ncbi:MAG: methionine--tRNA ligase subunit beta, partial [Nitrospirota bacterium]|nr:methionine--tRNA ligase subunit beta [Nitrospirota bacterium]
IALYLSPFMPTKADEIYYQLGLNPIPEKALEAGSTSRSWGNLDHGIAIRKGSSLFPRIVELSAEVKASGKVEAKLTVGGARVTDPQTSIQSLQSSDSVSPPITQPIQISIDEFMKVQLKTATVLTAERVPKSEKLIKLQVDLGGEQRQIVAGIGKRYEPEQLIGKRIVIVANLKPAKLMGIESQGMVLAAGDKDVGGLVTVIEEVPPGTKVK